MNLKQAVRLAVLALVSATVADSAAPPSRRSASTELVDLMVFGVDVRIDLAAYPPPVRTELAEHMRRFNAFRSVRVDIAAKGERGMVHATYVSMERKLASVTDDPQAPELAMGYVDGLRPCYEWERFHDCPEREARFAEAYQTAHPGGPFSAYLPLLAAHRWICAAEAYENEKRLPGYDSVKQAEGVTLSREQYERNLATALKSSSVLVRTAAEALSARGACHAPSP